MWNEVFDHRSRKVKAGDSGANNGRAARGPAPRPAFGLGGANADVAAIEPDSLPPWLRPGVEAARTMVERFKDVESVIEFEPEMWDALRCDECYRRKTVTEPLEQLIDAQREAESSPARANVEGIRQSSPKPSQPASPTHPFPRPTQGTRLIAQSLHAPMWLRNWLQNSSLATLFGKLSQPQSKGVAAAARALK
jgi:hypothetical protein